MYKKIIIHSHLTKMLKKSIFYIKYRIHVHSNYANDAVYEFTCALIGNNNELSFVNIPKSK